MTIIFSLVAAVMSLRERSELLLLRAIALVFAIAVLLMFNLNWLVKFPLKGATWILSFLVIFLLATLIRSKYVFKNLNKDLQKNTKAYGWSLLIMIVAFLLACSYFYWDLNVPRYSTPDSGTHFLYMRYAADTGKMSLFGENLIEKASGDATIAPGHNQTYFPGASAVFALLNYIVAPKNPAMTLQIFNAFCYALLSAYFILLIYQRRLLKQKVFLTAFTVILLMGTFFNFVATSHSTQLLGLLFLIAFADTYDSYLQKKESILIPAIFLGAMITTYFYWLPVALVYCGLRFILGKKIKQYFSKQAFFDVLPIILGFVFCSGYIITMFSLNMFQYASSDGGVAFQDAMLSDALFILPLAILQLWFLLKNYKNNSSEENFITAFFSAAAFFSLVLGVLYKNGIIVSHYTAMKSLYLGVPTAWTLALIFFERNWSEIIASAKKLRGKQWGIIKKHKFSLAGVILMYIILVLASVRYSLYWEPFKLLQDNIQKVYANDAAVALSSDQMKLLDTIKEKYPNALESGKIYIIGPKKNLLWAFAYSGIWPRTNSLIAPFGRHDGMYSELNYSYSTANDYAYWLKQDKEHYLVYFNADSQEIWGDRNLFDMQDFDKLEVQGDNYLLKLKSNATPHYEYENKDDRDTVAKDSLPVGMPLTLADQNLAGISVPLTVNPKKDVDEDVIANLYQGKCEDNGLRAVASAKLLQSDLAKKSGKRTVEAVFDYLVAINGNSAWCVRLESPDDKTSKAITVGKYGDGTYQLQPIYAYKQ